MIHSETIRSCEPVADRPKTLLYVDDHAVNLMLMRALLSHRPAWRLNMASDGEAACMIARSQPHDLLLLDLRLPDVHGTELLRRLREVPGLAHVPAVAVTAEEVHDLRDAGFCELWPKPLDLRQVLRRLDHFLGADGEAVATNEARNPIETAGPRATLGTVVEAAEAAEAVEPHASNDQLQPTNDADAAPVGRRRSRTAWVYAPIIRCA